MNLLEYLALGKTVSLATDIDGVPIQTIFL